MVGLKTKVKKKTPLKKSENESLVSDNKSTKDSFCQLSSVNVATVMVDVKQPLTEIVEVDDDSVLTEKRLFKSGKSDPLLSPSQAPDTFVYPSDQ